MTKYQNAKLLVQAFIDGAEEGFAGKSPVLSNTKIRGNQLIHFSTPILERLGDGSFVFNETGYSPQTKKLQDTLRELLAEGQYRTVRGVPQDYAGPHN